MKRLQCNSKVSTTAIYYIMAVRVTCECHGNASNPGSRLLDVSTEGVADARAVASGDRCLVGLKLRPFCAHKISSSCNVAVEQREEADAPRFVEPEHPAELSIAWCITGGVRSFYYQFRERSSAGGVRFLP